MEYIIIYIYIYIYIMNNLLFKNFKKIHFIYLLITIIIILLLLKVSVEGFIPYLINATDINNYCTTNPSGQYNAPTLISNYQCGNYNNRIPLSHTIKFNNLQLKNNLCPLNTIYTSPHGIFENEQCIINLYNYQNYTTTDPKTLSGILFVYDCNPLQYVQFNNNSTYRESQVKLSSGTINYTNKFKVYNFITYINNRPYRPVQSDMVHVLPSSLNVSNFSSFNQLYLPNYVQQSTINPSIDPSKSLMGIGNDSIKIMNYIQLNSYGYLSFISNQTTPIFTNNAMTIFIVYNVISEQSYVPPESGITSTQIRTSFLTANNKPFDIYDNIRSINNITTNSPFYIGSIKSLTLYIASVKTISGTVYWNEQIYNNEGFISYNLTIPGVTSWDNTTPNNINIGGNNTGTTSFYGTIGEIQILDTYLDPSSEIYKNNVITLLKKWYIKPFNIINGISSDYELI